MKAINTVKFLAVAVCATAVFGCKGTGGSSADGKKEGQVIAGVNSGTITTGDFSREVKSLPEYLKTMVVTPQGKKEMLDQMVIRELILQQAAKDGIDKSPEIEEKMRDLRKRLIVETYIKKKVESEAQVSDADLKKFYDKNLDKFKVGDQFRASHILVQTEKEAKDILAQVKGGGKFDELAKKFSKDSSAAKGGDLGWFSKGSMVPVFEKAALALKEGQVTDVVKSDFDSHIIKRTGTRVAGTKPFDEVKEQIKAAIMPSKQQEIFQKIREDLKKSAKINIKEDVLNSIDSKKDDAKGADKKPAAAAPAEKK